MEVVFVSSDDSEDAMRSYMKEAHGDWLTGQSKQRGLYRCL